MNNEEFNTSINVDGLERAYIDFAKAVWQAATASKQREIDALNKDITRLHYQHESERGLNDVLQRQVNALNQQAIELSAQVEVMREALRMMLEAGESEYGEDWFAAAMNGRQALSITPSSSLLAHDNEVAAKALEEFGASDSEIREQLELRNERNRK